MFNFTAAAWFLLIMCSPLFVSLYIQCWIKKINALSAIILFVLMILIALSLGVLLA